MEQTAVCAKPMHIYHVINQIDRIFGHKNLGITVDFVDDSHIFLKILYARKMKLTEENMCPKEKDRYGRKPGDEANQCAMCRLWITEDEKENPWNESTYHSVLWKDGIYVNGFTMSNYQMAKKFNEAIAEWCGCYGEYCFGQYCNIRLGKKLENQVQEQIRKNTKKYLESAQALFCDHKSHWLLSLYGNTTREQLQYFQTKIAGFIPVSTYGLFEMEKQHNEEMETTA